MFYKPEADLELDLRFHILEFLINAALEGMVTAAERRRITLRLSEIQAEFDVSKLQMIEATHGIY